MKPLSSSESLLSLPQAGSGPVVLSSVRQDILRATDVTAVQKAAVAFLKQTLQPVFIAWYTGGGQIGCPEHIEGLVTPAAGMNESCRQHMQSVARQAIQHDRITSAQLNSEFQIHAVPAAGFHRNCLLIILDMQDSPPGSADSTEIALLALCSILNERAISRGWIEATERAETAAALMELAARAEACDSPQAACQHLADALKQYLNAERVVIGLCGKNSAQCQAEAISDGGIVDRFSEATRLIDAVLQESIVRGAGGLWPIVDQNNRHALLAHQQLVDSGYADILVTMPVLSPSGTPVGSLLGTFRNHSDLQQRAAVLRSAAFLRGAGHALGGCLSLLKKYADSRWIRLLVRTKSLLSGKRLKVAGWTAVAVTAGLLIPVEYQVGCQAELQPVDRHFIATPFDTTLEECLAEPGDLVVKDQLLARLDGREIQIELAESEAALNKAIRERNTHLSGREFGTAAISAQEIQRLEQRSELLRYRARSLEIRSPIEGIVVSGDHEEAEGVPLKTGQTLFEVAPLNSMVVEIRIPEEEVRHVRPDMTTRIQLDAFPELRLTTTLRSIHPRAEVVDNENIFMAEADLAENPGHLRPGMKGWAKVSTGRHPLGWNLFHRPVSWLIGWLGW